MKSFHVLVMTKVLPSILEGLQNFEVHKLYEAADRSEFLRKVAPHIDALVTTQAAGPITGEFMGQFRKLRVISHFGVGYNSIDTAAAKERGIVVCNTPDVLTDEVADLAMALTLATIREIPQATQHLLAGKWKTDGAFHLTASMRDRTMGIIGLGRIGKAIAKRAAAFGVRVLYHGRNDQKLDYPYYASLEDMARDCDLLMITAPGGHETDKIVNAKILEALGKDGILINVARGSIVDEPALIHALKNGIIHAAGLDVYDNEPNVNQALMELPNAVLLPHVASGSEKTRNEMGALLVKNIELFAQGKSPQTPVSETPFIVRHR